MADEPLVLRTRASLKSCLKITPPITPERSAAPSPCTSGRTSPSMLSDSGESVGSGGRKTVSFCSDDELEEIHWADEWDRTPAAATPKLSYQDILELKQLRVHLPYSPPPPPPRQPFTTSAPSSSSKPPFPVSRFASAASLTPSKWKNRSSPPRTDVDPEILPYLDAVPIRLLPLLPQAEPEPRPPSPEPHPQTPTPTASPETRPTLKPPSEPPELRIDPPIPTPVHSPPTAQARKPNFAFLPLLPIQDPPPIPAEAPIMPPVPPRRKFNMNFLAVNGAPETAPAPSVPDVSIRTQQDLDGRMATSPLPSCSPSPSSSVTGTDPCADAGQLTSVIPQSELSATPASTLALAEPQPEPSSSSSSMSPPRLSLSLASLPLNATANAESDTDTETDTYTDTDAESDAPSTSTVGSSLHSPPCDYDDDDAFEDVNLNPKTGSALLPPGYYPRIHTEATEADPGSYFPPVALPPHMLAEAMPVPVLAHVGGPGQTPPLSVLYPSPPAQTRALPPLDVLPAPHAHAHAHAEASNCKSCADVDVETPVTVAPEAPTPLSMRMSMSMSMSRALQKKLMLEALPSPALAPPSPFELEPHALAACACTTATTATTTTISSSGFTKRTVALALDATPDGASPLLTVEHVRASVGAGGGGVPPPPLTVIAPSLSRRRSSR